MDSTRLLIVEDEIIVAKDMGQMLLLNGFVVVGMARNMEQALEIFSQQQPDLILCDINLRSAFSGIDFVRKAMEIKEVPVIYLTAYSDEETVAKAISTYPGPYITKPFTDEQLLVAIKVVLNKGRHTEHPCFNGSEPTKRELEIIKYIAMGMTSHEISDKLGICFETVQTHRKKILAKYNVHSSSELIALATKNKWVVYVPSTSEK